MSTGLSINKAILTSTRELAQARKDFLDGKLTANDLNAYTKGHAHEATKLNALMKMAEYNNRMRGTDVPLVEVHQEPEKIAA